MVCRFSAGTPFLYGESTNSNYFWLIDLILLLLQTTKPQNARNMRLFTLLCVSAITLAGATSVYADYTTPNEGTTYTFESLSKIADSGVSKDGSTYTVASNITISGKDVLKMEEDATIKLANDVLIQINGGGFFNAPNKAVITRAAEDAVPQGIYFFSDTISGGVTNIDFEYAGVKVFASEPVKDNTVIAVKNCNFTNVTNSLSTVGVVAIGANDMEIIVENCTFTDCQVPGVGSSANMYCKTTVKNCTFDDCANLNKNTPMINLTVGGDYPVLIEGNTVIGAKRTMVGGIGVSNMLSDPRSNKVSMIGNKVNDCRYGLTTIGNMDVTINDNILINNCYETNPMNGGSAISVYDPYLKQTVYAKGNHLEGSLWGVTVIGCKSVNFGKVDDPTAADYNPGGNVFKDNGNGGVLYDLYNNSANTVYAQCNTWNVATQDAESIESVIFHKNDDANLGEVIYLPSAAQGGVANIQDDNKIAYNNTTKCVTLAQATDAQIYAISGTLVKNIAGATTIDLSDLASGLYIVKTADATIKIAR